MKTLATAPIISLLALALLALPATAITLDELTDPDGDGAIWDTGLVWGVSGTLGLAALAGLLYFLGVGGLRHIDRRNVLEHPMRQSLMDVVETEPGVHLRELASRHGTAVTNTQWHLRKLEMAGLVRTQKVQGRRLYYPTAGGAEMKEVAVQNAALQNPNALKIAWFLDANSGVNQRTLAEGLNMNAGTVRWHLRKMEAAGLVRSVPEGTQTRYFLLKRVQRPARPIGPARNKAEADARFEWQDEVAVEERAK
jgi:predicted transcriptional regulator